MSPPILPVSKVLPHEDIEIEMRRALSGLMKKTKVVDELKSVLFSTFAEAVAEERKAHEDAAAKVSAGTFMTNLHSKRRMTEGPQEDRRKSKSRKT